MPIRKPLSNEEVRRRIANLQQGLTVQQDNINYARIKLGKPLEFIDSFILGTDKLRSWEEFIEMSIQTTEKLTKKIENYKRFLTEPYKWFIY